MSASKSALLTVLASGCIVAHGPEQHAFEQLTVENEVTAVWFDVGSGDVEVSMADVPLVEIERDATWRGDEPRMGVTVVNGELFIDVECGWSCDVDHVVRVPPGTFVGGSTGSGAVRFAGLDVGADFETGSGHIDLSCVAGPLILSTGSGGISGACVDSSDMVASTGSGDVELEMISPFRHLEVETGSGNVGLVVPQGAYDLDLDTGSGEVDLDGITLDSSSSAHLIVETGSGDIVVRGAR